MFLVYSGIKIDFCEKDILSVGLCNNNLSARLLLPTFVKMSLKALFREETHPRRTKHQLSSDLQTFMESKIFKINHYPRVLL
jgi:hypothetical protein